VKVVFNCHVPFSLAPGGAQRQIEQTKAALSEIGVETDYLQWWNDQQKADILHHFGRPPLFHVQLARRLGIRVVVTPFLSGLGSRPKWRRVLHRLLVRGVGGLLPRKVTDPFGWEVYRLVDACTAMTSWEAVLLRDIFGTPADRLHVVPNGVEDVFLENRPAVRGEWLVCTATIVEIKQVLKLAQAAVTARTPVWVIGKPYSETDPYVRDFARFAAAHADLVRYAGPIHDRRELADVYRAARGFVLLSKWESQSLSALEAATCGCPLLLSDLPWARTTFQEHSAYCPANASVKATARVLRQFYDDAPTLKPPPRALSWRQVAEKLKSVYEKVLTPTQPG